MNTPYHLLNTTAMLRAPAYSKDTSGANVTTFSDAKTVQCRKPQPMSTSESLQFARETAVTMFKVFLAPVDTTGAAYTLAHDWQMVIDTVTYAMDGEPIDVAGDGTLTRANVRLGPQGAT